MNYYAWLVLLLAIAVGLSACAPDRAADTTVAGRWYSLEQVARGEVLFQNHCAVCHGSVGEGLAEDWRKPDANGNYPPPPLNGTAHTWHHPTEILQRTIAVGGEPFGGVMPAFAEVIDDDEALDVIAYFQSLWTDDVYGRWLEIENR